MVELGGSSDVQWLRRTDIVSVDSCRERWMGTRGIDHVNSHVTCRQRSATLTCGSVSVGSLGLRWGFCALFDADWNSWAAAFGIYSNGLSTCL